MTKIKNKNRWTNIIQIIERVPAGVSVEV